jgi:hypothetical protein
MLFFYEALFIDGRESALMISVSYKALAYNGKFTESIRGHWR